MRNVVLVCIAYLVCVSGFVAQTSRRWTSSRVAMSSQLSGAGFALPGPAFQKLSLMLAEGLDADTLQALGDVQELNDALDGAIDQAAGPNAAADILTKVVASPFIIAVPILAGLGVAFAIGFFIFSYGNGKE